MSKVRIIGNDVPEMPWQERPAENRTNLPLWRYRENPIIGRNPVEGVARIFNSAVIPYEGAYIGVFRGEQTNGISFIYLGRSKDGIHWDFEKDKIRFVDEEGNEFMPRYAYDPRLVKLEDTYYIIWCQDFYGAAPIETSEGWLLFYHGVSGTCNGYVYSIGGAILDIDNPSVVKYRCETFLMTPEEWYEERGFVPNVTFPCATIEDAASGRIAIYYGAADSYVGLAFTRIDEVVSYIKEHSVLTEEDTETGKR